MAFVLYSLISLVVDTCLKGTAKNKTSLLQTHVLLWRFGSCGFLWPDIPCIAFDSQCIHVHSYSHVLYLASDYQITLRVHVIWLNPFSLCRLLVNMTQPAVICFGKVPTEKMERNQFLEVMSHLQSYKEVLYSVFSLFNNWYKYYYKFTSLISVTSFFALLEIARLMANVGHVCLNFFCVRNLQSYCNSINYCKYAKLRSCNKGAFIIYLLIVVNWYQKITLYSICWNWKILCD